MSCEVYLSYVPFFLSEPTGGQMIYNSPLEAIWGLILGFAVVLLSFYAGRSRSRIKVMGSVIIFLGFLMVLHGVNVYGPLLWSVFEAMPDGPGWLAEVSTLMLYGVVAVSLLAAASKGAYSLGKDSAIKGWF